MLRVPSHTIPVLRTSIPEINGIRPTLEGIFVDTENNCVLSTDSHRMSRVSMDEANFPSYQQFFPKLEDYTHETTIEKLLELCKKIKPFNDTIQFGNGKITDGEMEIKDDTIPFSISLDHAYLREFLDSLKDTVKKHKQVGHKNSMVKVKMMQENPLAPLYFHITAGYNQTIEHIIMPKKIIKK